MAIKSWFPTFVYEATLAPGATALNRTLLGECAKLRAHDQAGLRWCAKNYPDGYTSYASLDDLPRRIPAFQELLDALQPHVNAYARALQYDLGRRQLACNSLWINILKPGGVHTSHIHPHSIISGTCYVTVPKGSSPLKIEDPRLAFMMAAPSRRQNAPREHQPFVYLDPQPGHIILFESWLRHEVPPNQAKEDRISVSFNYA